VTSPVKFVSKCQKWNVEMYQGNSAPLYVHQLISVKYVRTMTTELQKHLYKKNTELQ